MFLIDEEKAKAILVLLASISDKLSIITEEIINLNNLSTKDKKSVKKANKPLK